MPYRAPVSEFQFLYAHVVGLAQVSGTALFGDASADTAQAILAEAGRLCEETLAPLNRAGDTHQRTAARRCFGTVRAAVLGRVRKSLAPLSPSRLICCGGVQMPCRASGGDHPMGSGTAGCGRLSSLNRTLRRNG